MSLRQYLSQNVHIRIKDLAISIFSLGEVVVIVTVHLLLTSEAVCTAGTQSLVKGTEMKSNAHVQQHLYFMFAPELLKSQESLRIYCWPSTIYKD